MSDEPLYCQVCGAEDWSCGHGPETTGPYCETCGVIPASGKACMFHTRGGRAEPCEPEPQPEGVPA